MLVLLITVFIIGIVGLNELFSLTVINIKMFVIIILLALNSLLEFKIVDLSIEQIKRNE